MLFKFVTGFASFSIATSGLTCQQSTLFKGRKLLSIMSISSPILHVKCRNQVYPRSSIQRLEVPDSLVPWDVPFSQYAPPEYTDNHVLNQDWADKDISDPSFKPLWNELDGKTDRRSYTGVYKIVKDRPRNPSGRTGLSGRGCLGKWGPNHAADPIVTRWKREEGGKIVKELTSKLPILQFVAIQRRDSGEWAFPGGMVDPGENISLTLKREFGEEALNSIEANEEEKSKIEKLLANCFSSGKEIYRGYVDDPRNTDNCWMETVAVNFHDATGESIGKFPLSAGDDAVGVKWTDASSSLKLYASHSQMLEKVALEHGANW